MTSETPTKKRSRSPTDDTPEKQHKRANTGAAADADESAQFVEPSSSGLVNDVSMGDANNNGTMDETPASEPKSATIRIDGDHDVSGANASAAASSNASSPAVTAPPQTSSKASPGNGTVGGSSGTASAQIHMRCLIVTQDASIIIGKGGAHVNEIRQKSGARVMVSESIPGNPERILNVSGPLDAVSKVWLCILFCLHLGCDPRFPVGIRSHRTKDKRRAVRCPICSRKQSRHHQIYDSKFSYGLSYRKSRNQNQGNPRC